MSMTTEQRKAWAYENLTTWLRDYEASELLAEWEDMFREVRDDVAMFGEDLTKVEHKVDDLSDDLDRHIEKASDLEGRVSDLEGWQEEQAS